MSQGIDPQRFIGCTVSIDLTDERLLEGVLTVIDPFGNLLLSNTYETSRDKLNDANKHTRELGLVSVRRSTIAKVRVDSKTHRVIFGIWSRKYLEINSYDRIWSRRQYDSVWSRKLLRGVMDAVSSYYRSMYLSCFDFFVRGDLIITFLRIGSEFGSLLNLSATLMGFLMITT